MNNDKIKGIAVSIVFHLGLLLLLYCFGYSVPYPIKGEEGMLINFGDSPTGSGDWEPYASPDNVAESPKNNNPSQPDVKSPQSQKHIPTQHNEETVTQDFEDAPEVAIKKDKTKKEKTPTPQPEEKPKEKPREVNRNALFPGKSNNEPQSDGSGKEYSRPAFADGSKTSDGQGDGSGKGNQGALDGSPHSPNTRGTGVGSVNGTSLLAGRGQIGGLPNPKYEIQESGKVVVKIKVDRNGRVVEAKAQQQGSTVMNATLYDAAERAAMGAKFSSSPDSPMYQWGTITYIFKLGQ